MMKTLMQKLACLSCTILFFVSCKKDDNDPHPPTPPPGSTGDVYVAGVQSNSAGKGVARYWKNGTAVVLTDGSRNAVAHDIVVTDDKVYVAGYQDKAGSVLNIATIWVNGVAQALSTTGGPFDAAMAIAVSGDDVHAAGLERGTINSNDIAKYWKNGTAVALTDGTKDAAAQDVFVKGSDVYVCGWENATVFDNRNIAKYWKNGVAVTLPLPAGFEDASAMSIFVSGSDVYVCGTAEEIISGNEYTRTVYWKNNVMHAIPAGSEFSMGISIFVSGSDIYVGGRNDNAAISSGYWKNNVYGALAPAASYLGGGEAVSSILVANADVYASGYYNNGTHGRAVYWKNGVATPLGDIGLGSSAGGIFVK